MVGCLRLPQEDVSLFPPHVLLELDGIRTGIASAPPETRPELSLVLSSILVKLSPRRSICVMLRAVGSKSLARGTSTTSATSAGFGCMAAELFLPLK